MSLPKGYKQLEYIYGDGSQYVDTLFYPKYNSRVVVDIEGLGTSAGAVFGSRNAGSATASLQFNIYRNAATTIRSDYFGTNASLSISDTSARTTIDKNANVVTMFGSTVTNTAVTSGECTYSLYLFAMNSAGSTSAKGSFKLYSCQCYNGGLLERDFIPCETDAGEIGLWDDVYGVFYGNAGTGAFTAGPETEEIYYTELEYIESDGEQYFDTGIVGKSGLEVFAKWMYTAVGGSYAIIGSVSGGVRIYPLHIDTYWGYGYNTYVSASGKSPTANVEYDLYSKMYAGDQAISVDGTVIAVGTNANSYNNGANLFVFALNNSGSASNLSSARLFLMQIYDNGTEVRDYVPMKHPSGVAGLWDSVNERFYASATTTDFIAGPEMVIALDPPAAVEQIINVKLAWTAVEKATFYRVYRDGVLLAETEDTLYVDETAELGQTYVYGITACRGSSESAATELTVYTREGYAVIRPVVTTANFP